MQLLPALSRPAVNLADQLVEFRVEITRRAALAFMLVSGISAWMVMSLNPFPLIAFLILLCVAALSLWIWTKADDRPTLTRYLLFATGLCAVLGLVTFTNAAWLPFTTLPVVLLASMLVERGEFYAGGSAWIAVALLTWIDGRDIPLLAYSVALALTVLIAWVVTFMVNTSLSWYQQTLNQAEQLLRETRENRGEMSKALKNLKLANDLQRRTEEELIVARKSAVEARIMKEKFAAKVSHELRTPLALIAGFSEVMYNTPEIYGEINWTPIMRRDISQVYHNARHLLSMVDDILNLSRVDVSGFSIALEVTPISALLSETAEIAADLFASPDVRFWTDFPDNLPSLRIDRTRIRQVILNLINNARRFTEHGEVCLSAYTAEQEVVISVRDTGPGIAGDKLELIFQEFYQVEDRLLRNKGGTGLGLAICRHFVETHGGHIWAESTIGRGSVFHFALPLSGTVTEREVVMDANRSNREPRILVVGADEHVLAMLRSEISGYEFSLIEDENHLAEAVAYWHPHAIVWNDLPQQQLTDIERVAGLPVPVIHCSIPSTLWLVKKLGIQACLAKPITSEGLSRELQRTGKVKKILLVDDDLDFLQLMERLIQSLGLDLEVRTALNGMQGLETAWAELPDLIFIDLTMPEMDGLTVIHELKDNPLSANIAVVLLTATLTPESLMNFPSNRVSIERNGELRSLETLALVRAVIGALEAHYEESTDQVLMAIHRDS